MAVDVTVTPSPARYGDEMTIAVTGADVGGEYGLTRYRNGVLRNVTRFTADDSGEWSTTLAAVVPGVTLTVEVRPWAEHDGTTVAAASAAAMCVT